MKRILLSLLLAAMPLLAACAAGSSAQGGGAVNEADLLNRRFVLSKVNGEPFVSQERTPELQFNPDMRVSGQLCNRFTGVGRLDKGTLTVPQMASTMMLCADQRLNELEQDVTAMLREGAALRMENGALLLSRDSAVFEYAPGGAAR